MEIERLWGQPPGWFGAQSRLQRHRLFAWYRVKTNPKGKGPARRRESVKTKGKKAASFWSS